MNLENLESWASIIGFMITIIGLFFGVKHMINKSKKIGHDDNSKKVGRDDNSIEIGKKNKITNSFNREK